MSSFFYFMGAVALIPLLISEAKVLEGWAILKVAKKQEGDKHFLEVVIIAESIYEERQSYARLVRVYSILVAIASVIYFFLA